MADPDEVLDTDTPLQAIYKELDLDDRLMALGALTNAEVAQELQGAFDSVKQAEAANDAEAEVQSIIAQQLRTEVDHVAGLDSSATADPAQWPRQKAAVARAYEFLQTNGGVIEENAAISQSKVDTLNKLAGGVGDAAKAAGSGIEHLLELVVVIAVLLVIASVAGRVK